MPRVWFVTGSSTGLGRTMVERALSQGDRVVATLRKPSALDSLASQYPATQLLVLALDVTSPASSVAAAFSSAIERFGRVDVVVSNAGLAGPTVEAEGVSDEKARNTVEVNFWGVTKVALEAVKVFRDVNKPQGGVFIQISSSGGMTGPPLCSYYAASKFAADGWLESLSSELDPKWNIKVKVMNPGGFKTPLLEGNGDLQTPHPAYTSLEPDHPVSQMWQVCGMLNAGTDIGLSDPSFFAKAVTQVVEMSEKNEDMPFHVPVGHDSLAVFRGKTQSLSQSVEKFAVLSKDLTFMAPQK